jgi:hypothetical protein
MLQYNASLHEFHVDVDPNILSLHSFATALEHNTTLVVLDLGPTTTRWLQRPNDLEAFLALVETKQNYTMEEIVSTRPATMMITTAAARSSASTTPNNRVSLAHNPMRALFAGIQLIPAILALFSAFLEHP